MNNFNLLKTALGVKKIKILDIKMAEKIYIYRATGESYKAAEFTFSAELYESEKCRCPICGRKCTKYDKATLKRRWRTSDLFGCICNIECNLHRVHCKKHGIITERVPFAEHKSRFSREFEQQVAYLALHLTAKDTSQLMRISWPTVGIILKRQHDIIEPEIAKRYDGVTKIGIDETSYKKGHEYLTIVVNHDKNEVIYVGKGKGEQPIIDFYNSLTEEQRNRIELVSGDGAKYIKSLSTQFCPNATFCIDSFHVAQRANDALNNFKIELVKKAKAKKKSDNEKDVENGDRYTLCKNPEDLTDNQIEILERIKAENPRLYRAYSLKESLREILHLNDPKKAENQLAKWLSWACRSRIKQIVDLSKKVRCRFDQILATVKHKLSNARIESINNKIKVIIRKGYGFRNLENLMSLIYTYCSTISTQMKPAYARKLIL